MKNRCTRWLAGAAAWGLCALAAAEPVFFDDFESETLRKEWSFEDVDAGAPVLLATTPEPPLLSTRFLAEFGGGDAVYLSLDLPQSTVKVQVRFRAYLLRTWDGQDTPYGGPDTFGYLIGGRTLLQNSFSNGAGVQNYCPFSPTPTCEPTWGSDAALKNQLGFKVELDPAEGSTVPAKGTPMSLVYQFDSGLIDYSDATVIVKFFSHGLQVHDDLPNRVIDESWGLDDVEVTAVLVPEPHVSALVLCGLLFLALAAHRRRRRQPLDC